MGPGDGPAGTAGMRDDEVAPSMPPATSTHSWNLKGRAVLVATCKGDGATGDGRRQESNCKKAQGRWRRRFGVAVLTWPGCALEPGTALPLCTTWSLRVGVWPAGNGHQTCKAWACWTRSGGGVLTCLSAGAPGDYAPRETTSDERDTGRPCTGHPAGREKRGRGEDRGGWLQLAGARSLPRTDGAGRWTSGGRAGGRAAGWMEALQVQGGQLDNSTMERLPSLPQTAEAKKRCSTANPKQRIPADSFCGRGGPRTYLYLGHSSRQLRNPNRRPPRRA